MSRKLTIEEVKLRCAKLGVKFLDNTYRTAEDTYPFQCACGETFSSRLEYVINKGRVLCLTCKKRNKKPIKLSLETAKLKCRELGIEFLDNAYHGVGKKYHFKCSCGNTFERRFDHVLEGRISCSIHNIKWNVEKIKECCIDKDVEFLDDFYNNGREQHRFKCACNRTFDRSFEGVLQGATKCPVCNNIWDIKAVKDWCINEGIEFLDSAYHGGNKKHRFQCACGNTFERRFRIVKHEHRTKCYECGNPNRWTIESIREKCKELNVEFLDDTYYGYYERHQFKCACGNIFDRIFDNVVNAGVVQCLECNNITSKGEKKVLDFILQHDLIHEREVMFDGLRGTGDTPLRFDFSITVNNQFLLIEYDGIQHFQVVEHFGEESFKRTKENDQKKNDYCQKNNIPLLRIPYTEFDRIEELLTEFIAKYETI